MTATELNDLRQRRMLRQMKAAQAASLIRERLGGTGHVEDVRIAALSAIAEARSVWDMLVTKGIASERQREEYLDRAFDQLLAQVEGAANQIMVPGGKA